MSDDVGVLIIDDSPVILRALSPAGNGSEDVQRSG